MYDDDAQLVHEINELHMNLKKDKFEKFWKMVGSKVNLSFAGNMEISLLKNIWNLVPIPTTSNCPTSHSWSLMQCKYFFFLLLSEMLFKDKIVMNMCFNVDNISDAWWLTLTMSLSGLRIGTDLSIKEESFATRSSSFRQWGIWFES